VKKGRMVCRFVDIQDSWKFVVQSHSTWRNGFITLAGGLSAAKKKSHLQCNIVIKANKRVENPKNITAYPYSLR